MAELTKAAQRQLTRHIGRITRRLRKAGHGPDEVDTVAAGLLEQVHAMLDGDGGPADPAALARVLGRIEPPDDWAQGAEPDGTGRLGAVALGTALVTLAGLAIAGISADLMGGDGGAVMSTIGLIGFLAAIILGWLGRDQAAGRGALIISAVFLAIFALVLVFAG